MAQSDREFIEWRDERYSTDIDRFDEQHKHLFGLLNDLHVALEAGHSEAVIGDILEELERYTEYHFGDEEEFMQDCGYAMDCADCFYNHREFHEEFVETVREFRERHENGEAITTDVLEFTKEWLDAHIAGEDVDQNYSRYYRESVPDDYEYRPGKLNETRQGDRSYEADGDVALASDVRVGDTVSIPNGSMADWIARQVDRHADRPAAYIPAGDGYEPQTFREFYGQAWSVAAGLLDVGVEPGTALGICAQPSYRWSVVDIACQLAGIVSVPIYPDHSEERAVAVETTAGVDAVVADDSASEAITDVAGRVFDIDSLPVGERDELPGFDAAPGGVATVVSPLRADDGMLGCAVTHRNLLAGAAMLGEQFPVTRGSTGTCLLPLSHIFQRVATYYLWDRGAAVAYVPSNGFVDGLAAVEPDVLVGVPRVYEHLRDELEGAIEDMGGLKQRLADGAAIERGKATMQGDTGSLTDSAAARVVFGPLCESLGLGGLDYALSGTEPLDRETTQFLWGCDIPLQQVYGAPELTGVGCVNEYGSARPTALGSPLPGTEVAVTEDGSVAFRGQHVVERYWETSDVAASATTGEWYVTDDGGTFDGDGRLRRPEQADAR